jgi:hypothetical protein
MKKVKIKTYKNYLKESLLRPRLIRDMHGNVIGKEKSTIVYINKSIKKILQKSRNRLAI